MKKVKLRKCFSIYLDKVTHRKWLRTKQKTIAKHSNLFGGANERKGKLMRLCVRHFVFFFL